MNDLPKRKPTRLKGYDYSSEGAYFITFCTKDRISNRFFGAIGLSAAIVLLFLEVVLIIIWLKPKHIN